MPRTGALPLGIVPDAVPPNRIGQLVVVALVSIGEYLKIDHHPTVPNDYRWPVKALVRAFVQDEVNDSSNSGLHGYFAR
jgi:hypothetical protein